jgi:hypothetical protein
VWNSHENIETKKKAIGFFLSIYILSHGLIKLRLKNPNKPDLDWSPMGIELAIEG